LWRGTDEVSDREWQRKKALQLFLLLVTWRGRTLHREQICDRLWPELAPDEAERDFKIAYSALCDVLEPSRKKHTPSAFFLRKGVRYGLRPEADVSIDAAEFEQASSEGDRLLHADPEAAAQRYKAALALYRGDYLEGFPYEEWLFAERERLADLVLRTAGRLAEALMRGSRWEEAVEVCEFILSRDSCREETYRQMMTAHERMGNRIEVTRTYERCERALREDCELEPGAETVALLEQLMQGSKAT
jgi:DNA-binding SARP family transcriptional activator